MIIALQVFGRQGKNEKGHQVCVGFIMGTYSVAWFMKQMIQIRLQGSNSSSSSNTIWQNIVVRRGLNCGLWACDVHVVSDCVVRCYEAAKGSAVIKEMLALMKQKFNGNWDSHSVKMVDAYFARPADLKAPPPCDNCLVLPYGALFPFSWSRGDLCCDYCECNVRSPC